MMISRAKNLRTRALGSVALIGRKLAASGLSVTISLGAPVTYGVTFKGSY